MNIICQCDVKHILALPIKTITSVLKASTYIITSIEAHPIRLAAVLVIMSVSTYETTVIIFLVMSSIIGG